MNVKIALVVALLLAKTPVRATPVPDEVKRVVGFIFVQDGSEEPRPLGTGFFVAVKASATGRSFGYFVTAKHVVQNEGKSFFRPEISVRLNLKEEGVGFVKIPLWANGKGKSVFVHPDPTVDLVVIPAFPDQNVFDVLPLDEELICTKREIQGAKNSRGKRSLFYRFVRSFGENKTELPDCQVWSGGTCYG